MAGVAVAVAKEEFGTIDRPLLFETEMLWHFRRKHELPIEMYSSESRGNKMPERGLPADAAAPGVRSIKP